MPEETRVCKTCGAEKDIEEFGWTRENGKKSYRLRACKDCNYKPPPPRKTLTFAKQSMYCIEDPSNSYDGRHIVKGAFEITLDIGYWPPHSKWRDNLTMEEYEVVGNERWHVLADTDISEDRLDKVREKQRLVKC